MANFTTFVGSGFRLQSVQALDGLAVLRLRFTNDPLASSSAGGSDGLNPANYALSGPSANTVTGVLVNTSDPQVLDLVLATPLTTGVWTVTASNVVSVDAEPLGAPTGLAVEIVSYLATEPVTGGATNLDAEQTVRRHTSPAIKGPFWNAMIAALAKGDQTNIDNARLAFDQLFLSSASGLYLDRNAAGVGLRRPQDLGMSDELFRRLTTRLTATKLTPQAILEVLEIFYGSDAVRASSASTLAEPFGLSDGMGLSVLLDEKDLVNIVFTARTFSNITTASATEVAAAITWAFRLRNLNAFAVAYEDPSTNTRKVRIYSAALGLGSSVRIVGGHAQNALRFPQVLLTNGASGGVQAGQTWDISVPRAGVARYKLTGASTTSLNTVLEGDYLNVFGPAFTEPNRGSFRVLAVDVRYVGAALTQYVDVENPLVQAQTSVAAGATDLLFFRPRKATTADQGTRAAIASQVGADLFRAVLPATTQAVSRTPETAAYPHGNVGLPVSGVERVGRTVTVTFPAAHGLSVGQHIFLDQVQALLTPPTPTAGTATVTSASPLSIWSALGTLPGGAVTGAQATPLPDGRVLVAGGNSATANLLTVSASATAANGGTEKTFAWSAAAPMAASRVGHRLTTLTTGRALVVGGATAPLGSELYNPSTNTWSTIAMAAARSRPSIAALQDGRVLAAGGSRLSSAEIFSPATSTWTTAAPMSVQRTGHTATLLPSGKVLVVGGQGVAPDTVNPTEVVAHWPLDDSTGTTVTASVGPTLTAPNTLTSIPGVIGTAMTLPSNGGGASAAATNEQRTIGSGDIAVYGHFNASAGAWSDVVGAGEGDRTILSMGSTVDFVGRFRFCLGIRYRNTAERVLFIYWNSPSGAIERYESAVLTGLQKGVWNHFAIGRRLTGGTWWVDFYLNGALVNSTNTNTSSGTSGNAIAGNGATDAWSLGAAITSNGWVGSLDDIRVKSGGLTAQQVAAMAGTSAPPLASCEMYDPATNTWSVAGTMAYARQGHASVSLSDGRVLVAGGTGRPASAPADTDAPLASCEVYDPGANAWFQVNDMVAPRALPEAIGLSDGRVFVAGGPSCEVYDPSTGLWEVAPAPGDSRTDSAIALVSGAVVRAGGASNTAHMFIPGYTARGASGLFGPHKVASAPSATSLTFSLPDSGYMRATSGVVTSARADAGGTPGPYALTPDEGVSVTGIQTTCTQPIAAGQRYQTLDVANASEFPDEPGYLVIGFGTSGQVGPVPYLGRLSGTRLLMSSSYAMPRSSPAGTSITLLDGRTSYTPTEPRYAPYLTSSSAGRVAAESFIRDIAAAGFQVDVDVRYPGERGLGGEGWPVSDSTKLSDAVAVWGGDEVDAEVAAAREETV